VARAVKVKDIARYAEVSIATVSRVLNNHENISEEIRQRVLQAATELGYFKFASQGPASRNTVERQIKEIGFLFCYTDLQDNKFELDPFWGHVLTGAQTEASKSSIRMIYEAIPFHQPSYLLQIKLHEMRVNGLLVVGPSEPETIHEIQRSNIPMVLIDNYIAEAKQPLDAVLCNNYEGAKLAINYFLQRGHRNIAYIGGYSMDTRTPIYTFNLRKAGYISALREAHIPVKEYLIQECHVIKAEAIFDACKRLIESENDLSAVFCTNDLTAIWAIKGFRHFGKRVPEDISVIGFDNIEMAEHLTPPLTTLHVPKEAMGEIGVRALLSRIADLQIPGITYNLEVQFIERGSVATRT
jgi:DNA-binding LacI/PurR family transcriptional regulator